MLDRGKVLAVDGSLALVEVNCLQPCRGCPAKNLCHDGSAESGRLKVRNPLSAVPGDSVLIDVPESVYNRALIRSFGLPLLTSLAGLALGTLWSGRMAGGMPEIGLIGFFAGLALGGLFVARNLIKHRESFYPVILKITQQGGCHGQA